MKTNEAPEKIILSADRDTQIIYDEWVINDYTDNIKIEYTRTDAFIEKAENFIYSALNDGIMGTCNIEDFLRLFKNYMKGE